MAKLENSESVLEIDPDFSSLFGVNIPINKNTVDLNKCSIAFANNLTAMIVEIAVNVDSRST